MGVVASRLKSHKKPNKMISFILVCSSFALRVSNNLDSYFDLTLFRLINNSSQPVHARARAAVGANGALRTAHRALLLNDNNWEAFYPGSSPCSCETPVIFSYAFPLN